MGRKRRGKSPSQRFKIDGSGITFEYKGFFNYITMDAEYRVKIINGLRVELTDNQIMTYFNIKKEEYFKYVNDLYGNIANLKFLLRTVPIKTTELIDVFDSIDLTLEGIKKDIEGGLTLKEVAKKYKTNEDTINRLYQTIIKVEPEKEIFEEKDKVEESITSFDIEEDDIMQEYLHLLGYSASNFDFEKIDNDILNTRGQYTSFKDFIENFNYRGIENIIFIRQQLMEVYRYSRAFYPSEDIILERLYSRLGKRVVEVMLEVIPNYEIRDFSEYNNRLKEIKKTKIHPKNSFGMLKEEKYILRQIINKGYPINNRFLPWYTNQEVQNFALYYGYTDKKPNNPIDYIEVEHIDLEPYIEIVKGYKEIMYHDVRWTTDRHNFLKENYKEKGPEIIKNITWSNKAESMLRVKQFSMKQRYSEEETQRIAEVFKERGFEGLKEEFPNRSESALRYKVEDLGLIDEINNISLETLKAEVLEDLKQEEIEKIRKEETERIRKEEINNIKKEVEQEVSAKIEEKLRKQLEYSIRKELEVTISQREVKRTEKEIDNILSELFDAELLKVVNSALTTILPRDYGTKLITELYDGLRIKVEELFNERFKQN